MKKYILSVLCIVVYVISISAQKKTVEVSGTIVDSEGVPLIGATVVIKEKPGLGVVSDMDGKYKIEVEPFQYLVFSYVGYETQEHLIKDEDMVLDITMHEAKTTILDEVTITGMGPQKKITTTGSITTVEVGTLKTPVSSITNALAGNVAGVMAMQRSGQPGDNVSEFWIRGISTFGGSSSALVLVDGFERSMDELNIEDIESFTVLKDASTTAIYGSRGANGVILVNTKRGSEGKLEINAKGEYTWTTRTRTPKFVDGLTYASMANEARTTRNQKAVYTDQELMMIDEQLDPDIYPNVNWMDLLLKDGAPTYRASVNMRGGGSKARYYLSGSFLDEGGMYHVDKAMKEYDTNANYQRYNYRLNLDMNVTASTLIQVGIGGALEKTNRSGAVNTDDIWYSIFGYNPITMPVMYSNGYVPIMQGEDAESWERKYNPWVAATQTGYTEVWQNTINSNVTLDQKLDFITEGLKFIGRFGYDTYNYNHIQRRKNPEMWRAERQRNSDGELVFNRIVPERLLSQGSSASGDRKEFLEAELIYGRNFGDHNVASVLKYTQDNYVNTSNIGGDIMQGIARRHQGLAGSVSYGYMNRYLFNFNFGYNGSENFAKGHQFGFFPAYSIAWNVAEESFVKDNIDWLSMFKIRYSDGKVGTDNTPTRFPYLATFGNYTRWTGAGEQEVYYNWGDLNSGFGYPGLTYTRVSSNNVTWEIARKHDLGFDLYLWGDKFGLTVDYFDEKREGIYMTRSYLPDMVGIQGENPAANVGSVKTKGFDGNFKLDQRAGDVGLQIRGNFTYSKNKITEADEMVSRYPYLRRTGFRIDQAKGLIALGLFEDYEDIRNSPRQDFADPRDVMPGDIKYKDINGDGIINNDDIVPIGSTTRPNLIYGLGLSATWKGFDFNMHFQGAGKSHFFIDGFTVYPFSQGEWGNILEDMANSNRWILGVNEDPNAEYPRLSYGWNSNNYRPSTYWLRDGSYLRLKTLEMGYTLPKVMTARLHMNNVRIHFIGQNLLTFSNFKLWDPEMGSSNGMKYPLGKTVTFGLTINM
ncbi:SusC/RagA family TonB-linked outer membrane protein [Anaerorudis cellulosivorans]|uniref:SusC/RagA family TonB-linked outer membrane protein n=1 Tax=Anaerorudis cellulosivorans TaxID=3397862 RepID=UPI002220C99B|nr:TonB-dependent receptor [Seramator thermalis]MCW1736081.1 TonB-dependent receptor [Seramator thermalis]